MTRPSEAEVTEAAQRLRDMADVYGPDADDIPLDEECPATVGDLYRVLDHLRAALSTPPLPSAEPVAWKVEESLDGRVYNTFWFGDDPERAERIRARMDSLGVKMTPLYTTPPAAAQDTGLDRAAERLALEAFKLTKRGVVSARSPLGDALLDYGTTRNGQSSPLGPYIDAARAAGGE